MRRHSMEVKSSRSGSLLDQLKLQLRRSGIDLLGSEDQGSNGRKRRGTGPTGKMRRLFEAASQLPRSQQEKITALLEPFVAHHAGR
jgi:hypothetical protein